MGSYLGILLLLLAAVLQSTFMPQIRIFGGTPDLVFLIVLAWSVNASLESSVTWAFIGGVAQDLLSASPTGASVVGMLLVVFGVEQLKRQVYRIGFLLILALVMVGTLTQKLIFALLMGIAGFQFSLVDHFVYVIAPSIAYNLVFTLPVLWLVRRLERSRDQRVVT